MAPKGLVVTVNPGASAFFAGELFSATITFTNSFPPDPSFQPSSSSTLSGPRSAVPGSSWRGSAPAPPSTNNQRARPPSASHVGLAQYDTTHLNSDEVPASPYFGSTSGQWAASSPSVATSSSSSGPTSSTPPRRPSFNSTFSGGALPTPQSASFQGGTGHDGNGPPPPTPGQRSASGVPTANGGGGGSTTTTSGMPTRKGLIGKPLVVMPVPHRSGAGLYGNGPRRPGGGKSHARSQSLAASSPDLLGGGGGSDRSISAGPQFGKKGHAKSRLGGSVGGAEMMDELRKSSAPGRGVPAAIAEEASPPTSPTLDAAFPPSASSNDIASASNHYPYPSQQPTPLLPNASSPEEDHSDSDSDGSNYDPTDSHSALPGQGFYGIGQNETMDNLVRDEIEGWTKSAGPTLSRFDDSPSPSSQPNISASQYAQTPFFHPPNTISLLWSFAHLEGTFEVDETLIKTAEFVLLKKELVGGFGAGVGGGTLKESKKSGGGGWKDWIWGGGGGENGAGGATGGEEGAASLEERKAVSMREKTIPTFSSPPSILGVDVMLAPGQSKSYNFSIRVPADLPPSFRGKSIKFSYHLVVGSNRVKLGHVSSPSTGLGTTRDAKSRVMRVPVRVYNHVGVTGARPFYDLTNPIVYHRDEAITSGVGDPKVPAKKTRRLSTGRQDFEDYAANLLDSVVTNSPELVANASLSPSLQPLRSPTIMEAVPALRPERRSRSNGALGAGASPDDDEDVGCKAAVEIVSRNSQKVSYDINKDGYMVASLTLVKSAYRLGETVNGSVVINSGDGRVLRVSARLETHELIETTIATKPAPLVRLVTRRLHAEHHETTLDSARVGFALAIPSGATPDFGTSGVKLQWSVRLSFLVIPPSPDAPLPNPNLTERDRRPSHNRLPSSMANGTSSTVRHGRSKSFAYGFEPAVPLTLPAAPMIPPSGAAHLMPVLGARDTSTSHTSYRAVPDLGFVPVLFSSNAPEPPPAPGPLQRSASGHTRNASSISLARNATSPLQQASVVLVPAKVDTVECSIPIKVYPGNTPFRPTVSVFEA